MMGHHMYSTFQEKSWCREKFIPAETDDDQSYCDKEKGRLVMTESSVKMLVVSSVYTYERGSCQSQFEGNYPKF